MDVYRVATSCLFNVSASEKLAELPWKLAEKAKGQLLQKAHIFNRPGS